MTVRRATVFHVDSIPFEEIPWGKTKVLVGRDASDEDRRCSSVMVKITENAAGAAGNHQMHNHPDQDEVLLVLEGHGENEAEDGTVQEFGPGDILYIPAGVMHEDRSKGGPVKFLVIKVPPD
jgi:mannose-6-phosphate isomerase-like protein (cupin superfamily)